MRTAEEIMKSKGRLRRMCSATKGSIIAAINQARKEALEEAAEKVNYPYRDEYGCHCDVPSIVLSLINELK